MAGASTHDSAGRCCAGGGGGEAPGLVFPNRGVQGTFRFPVLLGLFSDSPAPSFSRYQMQAHFFDGPNATGTIRDLYREMSGGAVEVIGELRDWSRSTLSRAQITSGVSGLASRPPARVGSFIFELLAQTVGVDWGRYDNDGPDGVPNSGDDDGYVDVLAVVHPTPGAECGGSEQPNRIWSHKWTLLDAAGQDFVTSTPSARGGPIRISDYTVQPSYSCDSVSINEIGVFAHELGHGFGLTDLYSQAHAGAGRWDLMGTGSWGCSSAFEPERPCHMGAWSKAALGWVDVETISFGSDSGILTLEPVETARRVVAIPYGDESGEYFLLENRKRIVFDSGLAAAGLLIWHIDLWWIDDRLASNTVNETASRLGVWLRQADGLNQLAQPSGTGNRGDPGDPFLGSNPASFTHTRPPSEQLQRGLPSAAAAGVTLTGITETGGRVSFRVISRYQNVARAQHR